MCKGNLVTMFSIIKPLNHGGILFGSTWYNATNERYVITRKRIMCSILIITIAYLTAATLTIYILFQFNDYDSYKIKLLKLGRNIFSMLCFFADILLTFHYRERFESAFNNLRIYDSISKFNNKIHGKFKSVHSQTVLILLIIYWIIVGYIAYNGEKTSIKSVNSGFGYCFFYGSLSIQILNFCGFMLMIFQKNVKI